MPQTHRTSSFAIAALIAAISLSVLAAMWRLHWPDYRTYITLVHGSAALSLVWSLAGLLLTGSRSRVALEGRRMEQADSTPQPEPESADSSHRTLHNWIAVLRINALALGLVAVIPVLYCAALETVLRAFEAVTGTMWAGSHLNWHANLWPSGMTDLSLLTAATVAGRLQTSRRQLNTALFWMVVLTGLWSSLLQPSLQFVEPEEGVVRFVATRWSALFMSWSAAAVGLFTLAGGYARYRWRVLAWPHDLWKLTSPSPEWPGFRYSAGVVSVVILFLGLVHVTSLWTPPAAAIAGASMLALAGRKWEENLADVGLALVTLTVVSLTTLWRPATDSQSEYLVEVFNRVLIGLAIMAAFWHWLARMWSQQLDHGEAWTTAGRLIRPARRVGFLVAAAGLLVSANLAMWPMLRYVEPDHSIWRWAWGLSADLLLVVALTYATVGTQKPTLGWLWLLAVGSSIAFAVTRVRGLAFGMWWAFYWPLVMTAFAAVCLLLAVVVRRTRLWQAFWESLYLSGILILPMIAIMGVSFVEQLHLPRWVPSGTFGCLTGVYLLAAWLPGPRAMAIVAGLCALAAVLVRV